MKFKIKLSTVTVLVFCAGLSRSVMACPGISLPAATTGNTMSFGVALVYSLPIMGLNVPSSPNPISDCVVVTTDSNGALVGNKSAVNDRYGYGGSPNSHTGDPQSSTDPVNDDAAITWGTMVSALQAFLNNRPGFANFGLPANQTRAAATGNAAPAGGDDGVVTGNVAPGAGDDATVTGNGAPAGGNANVPEARNQVCLNGPVGIGTPIPCVSGGNANPDVVVVVNENPGAEHAAKTVVPPELTSLLNLTNFDIVAVVPEPGTLALFAMGLLVSGLWSVRRRRN